MGGNPLPAEETPTLKANIKPPVLVKLTKDGLLFLLDERCEFVDLVHHLKGLLFGETEAAFEGAKIKVAVDYGARELDSVQIRDLLEVFLQKDNFQMVEWGPNTEARRSWAQTRKHLPKQNIFKGTVRAGQRLVFDGDVVVIGDVNPGGEVVASGDVYVLGKLAGVAHSGATGNRHTVIAAADFSPMQLRIASIVSRAPEENGKYLRTFMEFAYLRDNGMAVDKLKYLHWAGYQPTVPVATEEEAL